MSYPIINHFGLSSGKDSTALWGWAFNESGYPVDSIRGSFADTENEYPEVYAQIEALSRYGTDRGAAPVRTLHPRRGFLELAKHKHRFPSAKARFCTEQLKIVPFTHYLQELWLAGFEVVSHSGVRGDESTERGLMEEWSERDGYRIRRPLLSWTISDVWGAHHKWDLPINPLYKEGWKRVGCRLCCMSKKADVRRTAKKRPWVIELYRKWESEVGIVENGGFSSFFHAEAIPDACHSRSFVNRKGVTYSVGTIDDVVRWSRTVRGGVQSGFDFMFEQDDAHHPCMSGYCE